MLDLWTSSWRQFIQIDSIFNFFLNNPIIQKCHLSEKVVVDVQSASSSFLGKVIRRANEVKVADDFTDPLLIDVSVVDVIPIGVLKKSFKIKKKMI